MEGTCEHSEICGRNALDGHDGKCILHSKELDKDQEAFEEALEEHQEVHGPDFREMVLLADSDLSGVDFSHAKLGGADLTGVTMPDQEMYSELLNRVNQSTAYARKLFFTLLAICVYCWLTIGTTTDAGLIANRGTSPLPIIGTNIPMAGFYWAIPLPLLAIYMYFHLQIQRLWEDLAILPAVFPDGQPLDKKADPWLLLGLIRDHFLHLEKGRPFFFLQKVLVIIVTWWIVPITLLALSIRYLPKNDLLVTIFHSIVTLGSVWFSFSSYRSLVSTGGRNSISYKYLLCSVLMFVFILIGLYSWSFNTRGILLNLSSARLYNVDLSRTGLSGVNIKRGDFYQVDLRGSRLTDSKIQRARLHKVQLDSADLTGASLENSNFSGVNFSGANLSRANLSNATFNSGILNEYPNDLSGVNLYLADLSDTYLELVDLSGARLWSADLSDASLYGANLSDANLWKANLSGADLTSSKSTFKITQEGGFQRRSRKTNLSGASLYGADLSDSHLRGAVLSNTVLHNVDVTVDSLCTVTTLKQAQLRDSVITSICKRCPKKFGPSDTYEAGDPRRCGR